MSAYLEDVLFNQDVSLTMSSEVPLFLQFVSQFRWLREKYVAHHLQISLNGSALRSSTGDVLGRLEEVRLNQNRLSLRGWARVKSAIFRLGPVERHHCLREERMDVASALGCDPNIGFTLNIPYHDAPLQIELVGHETGTVLIEHDLDVRAARRRSEKRVRRQFWRDLTPLMPMIALGLSRRDPDLRRRVKTALRLDRETEAAVLDPHFLVPSGEDVPGTVGGAEPITIILPVYNAFDLLPEVLRRIEAHTDLPWHLIVVEDASTEPRLRPWLRDWVARQPVGRITLHENQTNEGFIRSVNHAFSIVQQHQTTGPVVLLNSDAMVPQDWASRLTAPLRDNGVASVTPLSNDAEIFSAPFICKATALAPGQADVIDTRLRARIAGNGRPEVATPTGVGFCMAMSRVWIDRIGTFDTGFGRGYGEEVDWCRRCSAAGARHVTASDLFVEHRGGASFGPEKQALVQKNNRVISARYPGYDRLVQDFIRTDPLVTARLTAALAWADSLPEIAEIPVYIAHSMGGGAEDYLHEQRKDLACAITLRFGGALRCQIELETPTERLLTVTDDLDLVVRLIGTVTKRTVIYSCAVGDPDLRDMPGFLLALSNGAPLEILFHDYLPISPSYTLLDQDGVYRGVPDPETADPAHSYSGPDGSRMPLLEWQAGWAKVMQQADRLTVFSHASARIVAKAYPVAAPRLTLRPHRIAHPVPPVTPPEGPRKVIGVLGAIGPQKGAAVVSALSAEVEKRSDLGLVLIGYIAPGYALQSGTIVHGRYDPEDIAALARNYGVTHWLVPSIWPETFCYTVHECLGTGLPTLAFDLGSQGDAVKAAENGLELAGPFDRMDGKAYSRLILNRIDASPN